MTTAASKHLEQLSDRLRVILVEHLAVDEDEITRDALLTDDLGADSLDVVEIIMRCEEEFAIEIEDDDADKVRTFADLVSLVDRLAPAVQP